MGRGEVQTWFIDKLAHYMAASQKNMITAFWHHLAMALKDSGEGKFFQLMELWMRHQVIDFVLYEKCPTIKIYMAS